MKKQFFLINIFSLLIFMSCEFSPAYSKKPDSYFFNKMEPLEWSEDYVLAATLYPQQIQVWNSKTNKLVHKYSLHTDESKWGKGTERALDVEDMTVLNGVIWFVGVGLQRSLIRLDCKTGEMRYIELDMKPSFCRKVLKDNDEESVIITANYPVEGVGIAIRILNSEGNIIEKYNISHKNLTILGLNGVRFIDEKYYITAFSCEYHKYNDTEEKCFYILELDKNGKFKIEELSFSQVLSNEIFCKIPNNRESEFYASFDSQDYVNSEDKIFINTTISGGGCSRILFTLDSFNSHELNFTNIIYNEDDNRSVLSLYEYNGYIFFTGDSSYKKIDGLSTGLYPKTGGNQIKHIQMPYGNQIYCEMKEDCAWFSKNIYFQDKKTLEWNKSQEAAIYKLDYKNQTVYEYDKDGNCKELTWIEG